LFVFLFWLLFCLSSSFDCCIVCLPLLTVVLFVFWLLYCLSSSFDCCIVCFPLLTIVLFVFLFWLLYCLSSSFDCCIVCLPPLSDYDSPLIYLNVSSKLVTMHLFILRLKFILRSALEYRVIFDIFHWFDCHAIHIIIPYS
jgi:hypothetical protein